ncbi:MAG: KpsF/GutQ family sugar-phosphate isomerase [Epsilonproteobacteria bacterium]|nr:KpsF/GutQ family sugar-phosphate isomerase [Campylobacterota bacterium]
MKDIKQLAKEAIKIEAQAVMSLVERVDEKFEAAVDAIFETKGKVVVTGVGKSGLIGKKIASTFSSTGTPSVFLHPSDAAHGDLGILMRGDLVIALSKSGNTDELITIMPAIKRFGNTLIAIVGSKNSQLAKQADIVLDGSVAKEACPLGIAPTASTTVSLVIGDALAAALIEKRGFSKDDFSSFHPSGTLGRQLIYRVYDLMHTKDELPVVKTDTNMNDLIYEISSKRLGVTTVVDKTGSLTGIITDGDIRRAIEKNIDRLSTLKAGEISTVSPKIIDKNELAIKAANVMEKHRITSVVIIDDMNCPIGIIHMHDILAAGIL